MRRRLLALLTAAALVGAAAPEAAPALGGATLAKRLATQMNRASRDSGAYVTNLTTGQRIFRRRDRVDRIPASNEKLWTTVAALETLGPDAVLTTTALARRAPTGAGVLRGNLYLRGSGDPTLSSARLEVLAQDLADAGLTRVTGRVVGDESAFDRRRGPASRGIGADVGGPLGALVVDRGASGSAEPAEYAAEVLARELRDAGVKVSRNGRLGQAPADGVVLGVADSAGLALLIREMNVPSDNYIAEMLLKVVGDGRTADGAETAEALLADSYRITPHIRDGSGLSRRDRTNPREVVALLTAMVDDPAFYGSLAVMGVSGTLADRLEDDPARGDCRGKTGTLSDVSALSGYCETTGGDILAFSFLMNETSIDRARLLQDRMVSAIARYE